MTTLNRLMDFDADNAIGAVRHERSPERLSYRNGYRDRVLETRAGALDLKIPKLIRPCTTGRSADTYTARGLMSLHRLTP